MKTITGWIAASTNRDSAKPIVSEEDLLQLFNTMPDPHILNRDHDESLPPAGKAYNKRIERQKNGDLAILVDVDLYDENLLLPTCGLSVSTTHITYTDGSGRSPAATVYYDDKVFGNEFWKEIVGCSDNKTCIYAVPKVDRDAGTSLIVVLSFISLPILHGFLGGIGSDAYNRLKQIFSNKQKDIDTTVGGAICYHLKTIYKVDQFSVEVLIAVPPKMISSTPNSTHDLQSLTPFLDKYVGASRIYRIVVEPIQIHPYWHIIQIVDMDGKAIDV